VISPSQRPLPDNTQHSQQTNIHAPGGIQTYNLSRRAAADLRLRPRGHGDRQPFSLVDCIVQTVFSGSLSFIEIYKLRNIILSPVYMAPFLVTYNNCQCVLKGSKSYNFADIPRSRYATFPEKSLFSTFPHKLLPVCWLCRRSRP